MIKRNKIVKYIRYIIHFVNLLSNISCSLLLVICCNVFVLMHLIFCVVLPAALFFFLLEVESFGCSLSLLSRFQSFFVFVFEERCLFVWLTVYVLSFLALCKSLVYRIFGIIGAPCELHNTYIK
jgi:hypothetical protein